MDYQYDVFISYASEDREWARKLHRHLSRYCGLQVFFDDDALRAGEGWEGQLFQSLKDSRHLVVMHSEHAKSPDKWVLREVSGFRVHTTGDEQNRRIIAIGLDSLPADLGRLHQITDIEKSNAYVAGPDKLDRQIWEKVIDKVLVGLDARNLRTPIYRTVLTITEQEVTMPDYFDRRPAFGKTINELLAKPGDVATIMPTQSEIISRYGPEREDWKPFGGASNVLQITDDILDKINDKYGLNYRWIGIDQDVLWSDELDEQNKAIDMLSKDPSLIIIDPIALYDPNVKELFKRLDNCLQNKSALIIAFSPFEPSNDYLSWRRMIEFGDSNFYQKYFQPSIPGGNLMAQFSATPVDQKEAQRYIQTLISLTHRTPPSGTGPVSPYLIHSNPSQ